MLKKIYVMENVKNIEGKEAIKTFSENMNNNQIEVITKDIRECNIVEEDECIVIATADDEELLSDIADKDLVRYVMKHIVGYGMDYAGAARYVLSELVEISVSYVRLINSRLNGQPAIIAITERLIIREMSIDDLDDMYELYDSLKECPFIEQLYDREEEEEFSLAYIKSMYGFFGYGLWLVYNKEGQLVGRCGIENRNIDGRDCQEIGFLIGEKWQRKGYAREACTAILQYASNELCLEEMYLCSDEKNKPSQELAAKLGFELYACTDDGMNVYYKKL